MREGREKADEDELTVAPRVNRVPQHLLFILKNDDFF